MKPKRLDIEILRIVAAFSIVWYHSRAPGYEPAYTGLVVFLVLSLYLARRRQLNEPLWGDVLNRGRRLLVPWVVWTLAYGFTSVLRGKEFLLASHGTLPQMILAGSSIHLWYLPFIFVALSIFDIAGRVMSPKLLAGLGFLYSLLMLGTTYYWRDPSLALGVPWAQWVHASIAIGIGLLVAGFNTFPRFLGNALLCLVLLACFANLGVGGVGLPYAIGISIFIFLLNFPSSLEIRGEGVLAKIAECSFGVYLLHIGVLSVLYKLVAIDSVHMVLAAGIFSFALVFFIREKFPKIRTVL